MMTLNYAPYSHAPLEVLMKKALALAPLVLLAACGADSTRQAATPSALAYPPAARVTQVDDYYGTSVADPYR